MNVYVYPWSTKSTADRHNPYIHNFITALEPHCRVVNRERPTPYGLFGVVPWLRTLDVLVLHWAGNLPDKRGAVAQIALLRVLLLARSIIGYRIVYVLHNKVSHAGTRGRWKRRLVRAVLRHSDVVLTHARDGVAFAVANCPSVRGKIRWLPHPFESSRPLVSGVEPFEHRRYDILVWGAMATYKGVGDLVRFLNQHGLQQRYRILVAGKFPDAAAFETLSKEAPYITFENRFVPDDELRAFMADSRIILFPYRQESVLGSGALTNSLLSDALVIGPNTGAFRDCAELGLISTFDGMSELTAVIDRALALDREAIVRRRREFASQHTWEQFGRTFSTMLGG